MMRTKQDDCFGMRMNRRDACFAAVCVDEGVTFRDSS